MHEPWAPSASSVALRHSRALNVGSFHAPAERVLSHAGRAQVRRDLLRAPGRPHGELRGHGGAAGALLPRLLRAAAARRDERDPRRSGPPARRSGSPSPTARSAPRCGSSCARCGTCPRICRGRRSSTPRRARSPRCARACATACTVVDDEDAALAGADVVVAASLGQVTAPGVVVRALGAGAVPLASRLPVYEEILRQGDVGLHFEPGDVDVLTEQLERLVRDDALRTGSPSTAPRRAVSSPGRASPTRSRRSTRASPRSATTRTPSPRSARGSRSAS